MRIIRLQASNFKRLRAIDITPPGALVQVRGNNGQGKSSTLDAIAAAIGGEKLCPREPIRKGSAEATVRVELDEDIVIERRFTAGGSSLKLTRKDGLKYDKPQRRLDEIVGRLSFDPLAFMREPPKRQAEILRELAGVDLSPIEARRQAAYERRTEVNRDLSRAKAQLDAVPVVEAPDEEQSAAALLEEQTRRQQIRDANEAKRRELQRLSDSYKTYQSHIAVDEERIAELEAKLAEARRTLEADKATLAATLEAGRALKATVAALVDPDMAEIPEQLRAIEETNRKVRAKHQRAGLAARVAELEQQSKDLTATIDIADAEKADTLAKAKLPVEGLSFTAEGVTVSEVPLEQASQAEQLRVSCAMGMALHPKLRVMLVRDGSLLDSNSLELVAEMARAEDYQVWLEMVGKDGEGIVIEDGQVEGAAAPAEAADA